MDSKSIPKPTASFEKTLSSSSESVKKTVTFMQDNAPSHASKYSTAGLASKGLKDERMMTWPLPHLT